MTRLTAEQIEVNVPALLEFMNAEIRRRGYDIEVVAPPPSAMMTGHVRVPAYVGGDGDGVEKAYQLQEIEDAWNTQEPEPGFIVSLMPSARWWNPVNGANGAGHVK